MVTKISRLFLAAAFALLATVSAQATIYSENKSVNAWQYVQASPDHTLMENAMNQLQIKEVLENHIGGVVLIAPTDAAVEAFDPELRGKAKSDTLTAFALVAHHVPRVRVTPEDVNKTTLKTIVAESFADDSLTFKADGKDLTINGIPVDEAVTVANGVVYRVSSVLVPKRYVKEEAPKTLMQLIDNDPELTRFAKRVHECNLDELFSSKSAQTVTVLAPVDGAMAGIPENYREKILQNQDYFYKVALNHVLPGEFKTGALRRSNSVVSLSMVEMPIRGQQFSSVQVGTAVIVQGDIVATNGILHKISAVQIPPAVANAVAAELKPATTPPPAK